MAAESAAGIVACPAASTLMGELRTRHPHRNLPWLLLSAGFVVYEASSSPVPPEQLSPAAAAVSGMKK